MHSNIYCCLALNRFVNEIQKNGGLAQQQQQLQQLVQFQTLNMLQQQVQAAQVAHQQKSFQQQQSVPLPSNTTITPVGRQNLQQMQKQSTNYPRTNVPNKNQPQTLNSPQSRKNLPMTAKPIAPSIPPGINPSLNISTVTPKGYADNLAAKPSINLQATTNITPSLTITKTSSPSSSSQMAKSAGGLVNKPIGSNVGGLPALPKQLLPEAISMTIANAAAALSAKTSQAPSVSLTPANKSSSIKHLPITPQKLNIPQSMANIQKLSPTSPRLKQTPRKNTNPIKTSPGTLPTSALPQIDTKPIQSTSSGVVAVKPSAPVSSQVKPEPVKMELSSPVKPKVENVQKPLVVPLAESKSVTVAPVKLESKPTVNPPKIDKISNPQPIKEPVVQKSSVVADSAKKSPENVQTEKVSSIKSVPEVKDSASKVTEDKQPQAGASKPNELKPKDTTNTVVNNNKVPTTPVNKKTPVAKASTSFSTPVQSSAEVRVKRNRFKTIPYQSPTPEIELVSKISAIEANNSNRKKIANNSNQDDKLTLFYR